MNKKLLVTTALCFSVVTLFGAAKNHGLVGNAGKASCRGMQLRPRGVKGKVRTMSPTSLASQEWENDISQKLSNLASILKRKRYDKADIKKKYMTYFVEVKNDCGAIESFRNTRAKQQVLSAKEQAIARRYLGVVKKHYSVLSELDYNQLGTKVEFGKNEYVGALALDVLDVKNDFEVFMDGFGLLPDDYDNGLI